VKSSRKQAPERTARRQGGKGETQRKVSYSKRTRNWEKGKCWSTCEDGIEKGAFRRAVRGSNFEEKPEEKTTGISNWGGSMNMGGMESVVKKDGEISGVESNVVRNTPLVPIDSHRTSNPFNKQINSRKRELFGYHGRRDRGNQETGSTKGTA